MMLEDSPSGRISGSAYDMVAGSMDVLDRTSDASTAPVPARSNEEVATVLLRLAGDLLRERHPAVTGMIHYALVEIAEDRP